MAAVLEMKLASEWANLKAEERVKMMGKEAVLKSAFEMESG
jgi:hypothetical protein